MRTSSRTISGWKPGHLNGLTAVAGLADLGITGHLLQHAQQAELDDGVVVDNETFMSISSGTGQGVSGGELDDGAGTALPAVGESQGSAEASHALRARRAGRGSPEPPRLSGLHHPPGIPRRRPGDGRE